MGKSPDTPSPEEQAKAQELTQITPTGTVEFGYIDEDGNFQARTGEDARATKLTESDFQEAQRLQREDLILNLQKQLGGDVTDLRTVDEIRRRTPYAIDTNKGLQELTSGADIRSTLGAVPDINAVGQGLTALDTDNAARAGEVADARFESVKRRLDPVFAEQREALEQNLANQGITIGTKAYDRAVNRFEQQQGDTLTQLGLEAEQAGSTEAERLARLALSQRGQQFGEQATTFNLESSLRDLLAREGINLAGVDASNRNQVFQENRTVAQDVLNKQIALADLESRQRAQQFSEIGSLGGFALPYQPVAQSPTIGVASSGGNSGLYGALGAIGSAAITASDKRLKQDIEHVGEENGYPIYEFAYTLTPERRYKGVMAQDVYRVDPLAVSFDDMGYMRVDYNRIGIQMEAL